MTVGRMAQCLGVVYTANTRCSTSSQDGLCLSLMTYEAYVPSLCAASRSGAYYTWKVTQNLMIVSSAWMLLAYFGQQLWAQLLSATLLALFWQQCGWLAHDFLHHQVRSRPFE